MILQVIHDQKKHNCDRIVRFLLRKSDSKIASDDFYGKKLDCSHGSKVVGDVAVSRLSRVADVREITSSAATCASHKITETRAPGPLRRKRDPSIGGKGQH